MSKKYIVLVTNDPYGRDDGMVNHPAKCFVINNKIYDTYEEAVKVREQFWLTVSHEEIEKRMYLEYDLFYALRQFVLSNMSINVNGKVIENKFLRSKVIKTFLEMYGLDAESYGENQFDHDEYLYCEMFRDEPKVEIVEVNA